MLILNFILGLFVANLQAATITLDAVPKGQASGGAVTSMSQAFTVTLGGVNSMTMVTAHQVYGGAPSNITGISSGGRPYTLKRRTITNGGLGFQQNLETWYLIPSITGAQAITVSFGGSAAGAMNVIALQSIDPNTPFGSDATSGGGSETSRNSNLTTNFPGSFLYEASGQFAPGSITIDSQLTAGVDVSGIIETQMAYMQAPAVVYYSVTNTVAAGASVWTQHFIEVKSIGGSEPLSPYLKNSNKTRISPPRLLNLFWPLFSPGKVFGMSASQMYEQGIGNLSRAKERQLEKEKKSTQTPTPNPTHTPTRAKLSETLTVTVTASPTPDLRTPTMSK